MTQAPDRRAGGKPSLRTELLLNLVVLAAGALVLATVSALLAPAIGDGDLGAAMLTVLVLGDLAIFVLFGRYLVGRLVTRPIDALVDATEAVARGELGRRAPAGVTRELDGLAASVNRMTERLLDAQSALVRAEKLATAGRLSAGIAHEVGNPLAAIANYAEILRRRGADADAVAGIEHEVGRIDRIVRGLLSYARPQSAAREPLDPGMVVQGVVRLLGDQGVLRDVRVDVRVEPVLHRVAGDRVLLEQALVNLLLNAVDAAGPGGRVVVQVRTAAGGVGIEVRDSGPGVPLELGDRVFEPFVTTKGPGKGTGLGLAIAHRIVEDHGGRIAIGRAEEGGAAFVCMLPAAP
jgi:signal transduction histidine kinase